MIEETDDLKLIESAKAGNQHALAQILQQQYQPIYKFMVKLTFDSELAKDLTQDVMVATIKHFGTFDPDRAGLSTWMIGIGKHLWLDSLRKAKRSGTVTVGYEDSSHHKALEQGEGITGQHLALDPYDGLIESERVLKALKSLGDKLRLPVVLYYHFGYQYDEISKILVIPLGTVKSRMNKAMTTLRKELENDV